ncbi:hypothetical protein HanPSC8_Chr11g0475941 [Helianthus annuus]|nr:hypothetical protein HanPSC8_Chr11g0475941 [Helianthus annuus]
MVLASCRCKKSKKLKMEVWLQQVGMASGYVVGWKAGRWCGWIEGRAQGFDMKFLLLGIGVLKMIN